MESPPKKNKTKKNSQSLLSSSILGSGKFVIENRICFNGRELNEESFDKN